MSTRAIVRFVTREEGVSFSEHPEKWHAQLYRHSDGYPEGLGLDIANSLVDGNEISLEIDSLDTERGFIDYIYYVWQHFNKSTWISIFKVDATEFICDQPNCCKKLVRKDECIFVGEPMSLQTKYDN